MNYILSGLKISETWPIDFLNEIDDNCGLGMLCFG